jgi:hypothetical protein
VGRWLVVAMSAVVWAAVLVSVVIGTLLLLA